MQLNPALKMNVMALAQSEPALTRQTVRRLRWLGVAVAAALWLLLAAGLGYRPDERPQSLMISTALVWTGVATLATWLAWAQGTRKFWRARERVLVVLILGGPLLLAAFTLLTQVGWPGLTAAPHPMTWERLVSFGLATVPLLACIWLGPRIDPVHPRALGASLGTAAASWAGLILSLDCAVTTPLHMIVGHVLPVFAAAFVGLVLGSVFLDLRKHQAPPSNKLELPAGKLWLQ